MSTQAVQHWQRWLYAGAVLALLGLCLGCAAPFAGVHFHLRGSNSPAGAIAGICVEWGANWAGHRQIGLWWESSFIDNIRPKMPPVSSLQVHCGLIPWSRFLPTRGTLIHNW